MQRWSLELAWCYPLPTYLVWCNSRACDGTTTPFESPGILATWIVPVVVDRIG